MTTTYADEHQASALDIVTNNKMMPTSNNVLNLLIANRMLSDIKDRENGCDDIKIFAHNELMFLYTNKSLDKVRDYVSVMSLQFKRDDYPEELMRLAEACLFAYNYAQKKKKKKTTPI